MKTIAFDTLEFAKKLKAVNFTVEQAEALAESVAAIVEDNLATKADITLVQRDIKELEAKLSRDIKELEAKVARDLTELELRLKHDLTLRLGGMLMAGIAVVAASVKLL